MRLRVATWNLWWRFGDADGRRPAVLETLRELDADVIGLQEVWSRGTEDLASGLAADLGMHAVFGASPDASSWTARLPGDADCGIGNAVLARWPVHPLHLEGLCGTGRPLLGTVVDTPVGSWHVQSAHLSSSASGSAVRCEQVRMIAKHVVAAPPTDLPPLVLGDFNAEAAADEMRLLEGHLTAPAEPGVVLVNTRRWAADPDEPTWSPANPYVAPTGSPPSRIDHVLVGAGRGTVRLRVGAVAVFGDGPASDGIWPSDHYGVVVDLEVAPRES
ncbi:endonuclease/exonuclease/phosphatase family protein [Actinomycetospora chiangmaiensis]|uniref:endonuclease/exonuclease/phosphatase family protein n=1 Tax=Actinomycetospora chiangmaiensis TaxID=402650 RepID=UPI0012F72760|nr:endonuclease/exonuclease/phosphatase family protein [Actinomycetospora chiangmaiensis]